MNADELAAETKIAGEPIKAGDRVALDPDGQVHPADPDWSHTITITPVDTTIPINDRVTAELAITRNGHPTVRARVEVAGDWAAELTDDQLLDQLRVALRTHPAEEEPHDDA